MYIAGYKPTQTHFNSSKQALFKAKQLDEPKGYTINYIKDCTSF